MVIFSRSTMTQKFQKENYVFCFYLQEKEVCKINKSISLGEVLLNLRCIKQYNVNYIKK